MNKTNVLFFNENLETITNQEIKAKLSIQEMSLSVPTGKDWEQSNEITKFNYISKLISKKLTNLLPREVKVVRSMSRSHYVGNKKRILFGMLDYTLESETYDFNVTLSASLSLKS